MRTFYHIASNTLLTTLANFFLWFALVFWVYLETRSLLASSIKLELPKERVEVRETKPENVIISVDPAGNVYGYDQRIKDVEVLVDKLKKVSTVKPQPEVQIRGDMTSQYEGVGKILYACQRAGIVKVAFITEPPALGG